MFFVVVVRRESDEVWSRFHNHAQLFAEILIWLFPVVMVMLLPATMFKVFAELPSNWVTAVPFHWMVRDLFVLELVLPEMVMVPLLSDETEIPFVPVILTLFETEFQSFRIK